MRIVIDEADLCGNGCVEVAAHIPKNKAIDAMQIALEHAAFWEHSSTMGRDKYIFRIRHLCTDSNYTCEESLTGVLIYRGAVVKHCPICGESLV